MRDELFALGFQKGRSQTTTCARPDPRMIQALII